MSGSDYPRMMYRDGSLLMHQLQDAQLKVQNKFAVETRTVANPDEETAAVAEGWRYSPDPDAPLPEHIAREQERRAKDDEIERLRAELAERNAHPTESDAPAAPRRGRPPRAEQEIPA